MDSFPSKQLIGKDNAVSTVLRTMSRVDGYVCNTSPEKDDRFLRQFGIKVLTPKFDCFDNEAYKTTEIGRALLAEYPDCGGNTTEDWFFVEKDNVQMLVAEHYGQWFVGKNAYDIASKKLISVNPAL